MTGFEALLVGSAATTGTVAATGATLATVGGIGGLGGAFVGTTAATAATAGLFGGAGTFSALTTLGTIATAGRALSLISAGNAAKVAADHAAAQGRQAAGQARAASQRAAAEKRREGRFVASKALARAGSDAGSPGVVDILGDIGAEGEFRALNELFIGEERARSLETGADLRQFEGREARRGGRTSAALSVAKFGSTFASKYG